MWNPLVNLLKSPARKEEDLKAAEFIINSNRAIICYVTADQQLASFSANHAAIFKAYGTIAAQAPLRAIKAILELEKILKSGAVQGNFWELANDPIQKSLKDASLDTKNAVYKYIIDNAHKGQIADFLIAHAANIAPMLTSPKNTQNTDFIGTFLAHAAPKTDKFLATFEPQFTDMYDRRLVDRLSLTKKLLKACYPINGKDRNIALPAYVALMKDEQITEQVKRTVQLYLVGDKGFKQITNCLQELETLKSCSCSTLKRLKGEKPTKVGRSPQADKDDLYLYLYQLPTDGVTAPTPDSKLPDKIYVLATKPKGYGTPEDSGKVTAILASADLDRVTDAFAIMPFDRGFQAVLTKMAAQFAPPTPKPLTKQFDTTHYRYAPTTYLIDASALAPSLTPSFKLTAAADSLDLRDEQPSVTPINWDSLSLQQYPARAV